MAILKVNEMNKMSHKEIEEKLKELKMEMVKSKVNAHKSGKIQTKEIKRTIARLLTLQRLKTMEKTK